ncbi:MAG: rRNA pseudouridine synthase [Verrucomicrobiota bacterium]|nr:rRNA pseudouridine synthase [Verrucomicrobiota bacterium]
MKRLSKALAAAGVASRRGCEEFIFAGRVTVNGNVIKVPQTHIDWKVDTICVDGRRISGEDKKKVFLFHKPRGVLCSSVRIGKGPIVLDFFSSMEERLFTVGRLDKDSEGLIFVTNDGEFAHRMMHPSSGVTKEYLIKVCEEINAEMLRSLSRGAFIEGRRVRPLSVTKVRRGTVRIVLKEGKKHEVRILAEQAGLNLISLKRIRIGSFTLGSLAPGEFRQIEPGAELSSAVQKERAPR